MKDNKPPQKRISEFLDKCYEKIVEGIPGTKSCEVLAEEYLNKYKTTDLALKKLISFQTAKCTTSGFVTSLGGLITLPVAIPVNIANVLYVQMRMIGTIACIGGYNLNSDMVQTLVYTCLVNLSISDVLKTAGVEIGKKATINLIKKIPGTVLTKINQKIGGRIITKFGTKGVINMGKLVPVMGGVIGGGVDLISTVTIANRAKKVFIDNDFD